MEIEQPEEAGPWWRWRYLGLMQWDLLYYRNIRLKLSISMLDEVLFRNAGPYLS